MQQRRRRSRVLLRFLALGVFAGAALTAGPAQAVDAPGPYYAEPAWDQKFPALTRFLVLTDWNSEAVLDRETGLVWEKSPDPTTRKTWTEARLACTARTTGNRKGWRLPSVHELASLIRPLLSNPALPTGHPFTNIQSDFYWSATTEAADPAGAWGVVFTNGVVTTSNKATSGVHVWCVRGGMHADVY